MHPGLWLGFGDISGVDFWRNKGIVRHLGFLEQPVWTEKGGSFAVRNSYEDQGKQICVEDCRIEFRTHASGTVLRWSSTFYSNSDAFSFGDQEEMGFGVRMATPFIVSNGGQIVDSERRVNEEQIWGKTAQWCQYTGTSGDRNVGVLIVPDPRNFRPCWFHVRNYGLLVANAFGRNAFTGQEKSQVTVS